MAKTACPPKQSLLQHASAVLGQSPRDVAMYLSISTESLDWLGSIFSAIKMLHEKGGEEVHIKNLAGLGKYIADDISNLIDSEHEKIISSIEAAEGGAA
jgi:hypothetical protein